MRTRRIGADLAIFLVFIAVGVTVFSEGIRTVQLVGLLACGAASGAGLMRFIIALRSRSQQRS